MTAHDHREFVEGCYRCDLSRDEVSEQKPTTDEHLRGRWSNGDPVHIITDGVDRWVAPNHNGATWIAGEA